MNESEDIKSFRKLQRLLNVFQKVGQISWSADQTRKRYPSPEAMTLQEIKELTKVYLALGFDIEQVYQEWLKEYKEYEK